MHHAAIIVLHAKVRHRVTVVDVKVVLLAILDVVPHDLDELVAIAGALLMVEPNRMDKLVHDRGQPEAPGIDIVRLQVKRLRTTPVADGRVASRPGTDHTHVIRLLGARYKLQTGDGLDLTQTALNVFDLFRSKVLLDDHHRHGITRPAVGRCNQPVASVA